MSTYQITETSQAARAVTVHTARVDAVSLLEAVSEYVKKYFVNADGEIAIKRIG